MNISALVKALAAKGLSADDIAEVLELAQSPPALRKPKARFVPPSWSPSDSHRAKAIELGFSDEDFSFQEAAFREWEFKDGKTNFDLAFHRWLRESAKRRERTNGQLPYPGDRGQARISSMVEGARIAASQTNRRFRWSDG